MGWFFRCASSASWGLVCYPELRGPLHAVLVRLDESNGARPIGGSATSAQQVSFGEPTAPTNANCVQPERMLMKKGLLSARCVLCCHPSLILAKLPAFATLDPSVIKGQPPQSLTELLCVHPARISCQAAPLDIQAASRHCSVSVQQVAFGTGLHLALPRGAKLVEWDWTAEEDSQMRTPPVKIISHRCSSWGFLQVSQTFRVLIRRMWSHARLQLAVPVAPWGTALTG